MVPYLAKKCIIDLITVGYFELKVLTPKLIFYTHNWQCQNNLSSFAQKQNKNIFPRFSYMYTEI